jgi:hypothetical protein
MLVEAFDNFPVQDSPESSGTDMQKYGQLVDTLNNLSREDPTEVIPNPSEIRTCKQEKLRPQMKTLSTGTAKVIDSRPRFLGGLNP